MTAHDLTNRRNGFGVKNSSDRYRHIKGVLFVGWTADIARKAGTPVVLTACIASLWKLLPMRGSRDRDRLLRQLAHEAMFGDPKKAGSHGAR